MDIFCELKELAGQTHNKHLEAAKNNGHKIMGYFCSYIPEEFLHAAGFVPFRMRSTESQGTQLGDAYFTAQHCAFIRRCMDKALRGDYQFLDGVIFMNNCDHGRRLYDNWLHAEAPPSFRYILPVPNACGGNAAFEYNREFLKFKLALEKYIQAEVTNDQLRKSIALYNTKRRLLATVYERRVLEDVPIKGSELLSLMLVVTAMPVEESIDLIETVLEQMEGRRTTSKNNVRILIQANWIEEIEFLEMIEETGCDIVMDRSCLGSNYISKLIDEDGDPVEAILDRYLNHLSCPRMMDDYKRRMEFIFTETKKHNIDGIISARMEFCTLLTGENYILKNEAKKYTIPTLIIDREFYGKNFGQIKTRIQAFFEKLRNSL